jgi:protoheme IX farnesyltransferase
MSAMRGLAPGRPLAIRRTALGDYVALTKPRIMSLLLLTAVCAMVAGARGRPDPVALAALIVGGALACGGASALNHVLDRDIDRLMGPRTCARPVAAGRIGPARAAAFGVALSACSFVLMAALDNLLAALLALGGGAFYVLVYTRVLKRSTPQNIVIGGAAGAVPPLAGWAAARGSLGLGALLLFLIVLAWTPPHFWALALLIAPAYEAARVPMLPVVRGAAHTARQIVLYALALSLITLLPALGLALAGARSALPHLAGAVPEAYLVPVGVLDACLVALALRLRRSPTPRRAAQLFHFSLLYLALLFVSVAVAAAV